jgi:hypothetical protein
MNRMTLVPLVFLGCLTPMASDDDTCLDFVQVVPREPGRVQYTVPVVDFDTQLTAPIPVPGAALRVCLNATCEVEMPLCNGDVGSCYREFPGPNPAIRVLDFPYGLTNVTLRWSAPGYVPTDYVMGGPVIGAPSGDLAIRGAGIVLVSEPTYASMHAQVGILPDATRGTLALRVLGCDLSRLPGAPLESFNANLDGATGFSLSTSNLITDARIETDARGVVGYLNLPPQTLDVFVPMWEQQPTTFNVRPGTLTLGEMRWGLDQFGQ